MLEEPNGSSCPSLPRVVQVSAGEAASWRGRRLDKVIEWQERSLLNERNQLAFLAGAKKQAGQWTAGDLIALKISESERLSHMYFYAKIYFPVFLHSEFISVIVFVLLIVHLCCSWEFLQDFNFPQINLQFLHGGHFPSILIFKWVTAQVILWCKVVKLLLSQIKAFMCCRLIEQVNSAF